MRLTKRMRKKYVNASQIFNYWTAKGADVHFKVENFFLRFYTEVHFYSIIRPNVWF